MEVMKIVNKQYKVSVNKIKRTCLLHGRLKNIRKKCSESSFEESTGQSFWWFQSRYFHEPNGKKNIAWVI